MLREAVKHVIAIDAATNGEWFLDIKQEVTKLKNINEEELTERLRQLKNVLCLITTTARLSEPTADNNEIIEYLRSGKYARKS